jgi:site-specific DNA-cytosine methylase
MQTSRRAYNRNKDLIINTVENLKQNEYVRLRMLTSRESLRLMGLDDTDVDKMLYKSGNSEDQLFRQAGNSIVVDVLYHLFRKLFVHRGADIGQSEPLY